MRASGWFVLSATLLVATTAVAQESASKSSEVEAKKQFEAGVELFEQKQFEQASVAFARAYELRPSYKILYLVGKCEDAQRHFAASLDAFTRYLAEAGDQIDRERAKEVKKEIDRLSALVGSIAITSPLDGATVYVDDERRGATPLASPVFVDLGKHTVVVKKEAKELHREVVKIAGGQRIEVIVEVAGATAAPAAAAPDSAAEREAEKPALSREARRKRALLIGGIASLAVGAGAGVLGGVFTSKRTGAIDDMEDAQVGPKQTYDDAAEREKTDKAVMIGGFVGAGVFLAAGAVLVVLHVRSTKETESAAVSIRPLPGGLAVTF